jgi:hypothetical protein
VRQAGRGGGRARYLPARGGGRRGGGGGVVLLLLLLVGAGLLVWFLVSRGDGDSSQSGGSTTAAEGTITTSNGDDVLAAAADGSSGLAPLEDETVTARGAEVQSVVSDEAFWLGRGEAERVFVVVSTSEESPVHVNAGDRIDLSGVVRVLPVDFESRFGVTGDTGSSQLQSQGHYIEALSIQQSGS